MVDFVLSFLCYTALVLAITLAAGGVMVGISYFFDKLKWNDMPRPPQAVELPEARVRRHSKKLHDESQSARWAERR